MGAIRSRTYIGYFVAACPSPSSTAGCPNLSVQQTLIFLHIALPPFPSPPTPPPPPSPQESLFCQGWPRRHSDMANRLSIQCRTESQGLSDSRGEKPTGQPGVTSMQAACPARASSSSRSLTQGWPVCSPPTNRQVHEHPAGPSVSPSL